MPILNCSSKKSLCVQHSEELEKLKSLTITSADTAFDKLKFAKHCKNLESIIFENCSNIKYDSLSELFRHNPKIKKVTFVSCRTFGNDAFESFRFLDKSLKELDLTGYKISNDELKSLLRSGLTKLQSITFSNRCDVSDMFKSYYPNCIIHGLSKKSKDGKIPSSKSDFDLYSYPDRMRRHMMPRTSNDHHEHLSDGYDVVDSDNYARRLDLLKNLKSSSERRLTSLNSIKDLRIRCNDSSDSSSDDLKYIPKIYNESSSSQSSSDTDYDMKKSALTSKSRDKYERRK